MTWRRTLQTKTRQPAFLWRMVLWILALGIALGWIAEKISQPEALSAGQALLEQVSWQERQLEWNALQDWAASGAWGPLWWSIPRAVYGLGDSWGPTFLATLAGGCWFLFLWQAMKSPGVKSWRLVGAVVAVLLGVLSVWPTLFLGYWQQQVWGLRESSELAPGLLYFVLGVGLREELMKLVCLLPLLLGFRLLGWRNRHQELTVLVLSGCVGLGFAVQENIGYFLRTGGINTMGRFLTANPLHITLTGLAGLAVYRALRSPRDWGVTALGTLGLLVFAHGLYDAFIDLPALGEYQLFATILFALVVYQFFQELRDLRGPHRDAVSLSATFLLGVTLLTATTFVYLSATLGMFVAMETLASGVASLAVMVYLFLREMPETLVRV